MMIGLVDWRIAPIGGLTLGGVCLSCVLCFGRREKRWHAVVKKG